MKEESPKDPSPRVWIEHRLKGAYDLFFEHECTKGVLKYRLPTVIWQVVQLDPLTVSPRISCGFCLTSGWFREGEWHDITPT